MAVSVTAISPNPIKSDVSMTVYLDGTDLIGQTTALWDDEVNTPVQTALTNVTVSSAETVVMLPLGNYTLTLSDGVTQTATTLTLSVLAHIKAPKPDISIPWGETA